MTADSSGSDIVVQCGRCITIRTPHATREIHLGRGRLAALAAAVALGIGWTTISSAGFIVAQLSPEPAELDLTMIDNTYEDDLSSLSSALEAAERRHRESEQQLTTALSQIGALQGELDQALLERDELTSSLENMRVKLARAVTVRDEAIARAEQAALTLVSLKSEAGDETGQTADLEVMLDAMSGALQTTVRARDTSIVALQEMENEIATMELRMQISADRQEQMLASLEGAVQASFGPLETMFKNSGMDVETLVSGVRRSYSGMGGLESGAVPASLTEMADPAVAGRFDSLVTQMDRMNMLRVAASKIPYTQPVRQAHRFTSAFGSRRDPITGSRSGHDGIDLAGPRGTPISSTADGVVTHAGWLGGYGRAVKVRHGFGFETLYAHMDKIHVKVGDRIARGDQIGDMGNTGRSTGTHLHYEVRVGGKPVNPMTYIKASSDVF